MRLLFTLLCLLIATTGHSAVLVQSANGTYSSAFSNLSSAKTAPNVKTVLVTSPQVLTTVIEWPADRDLKFEKGGYITFTGSGALTGLKEARPEWFGGAGDWNGSTGTDNLVPLQKAVASLGTSGGTITLSNGTYRISNNWNITKSNVALEIKPSAHLFCNATTTDGHTVAFVGAEGAQIENVSIYGGGKISNTSAGATENAVGFVRAKNYKIVGMNIPTASKKGITVQIGNDYGEIRGNLIGTVGDSGISVEGDSVTPFTELSTGVVVDGNTVVSAGVYGVTVTYANASSPKYKNVVSTNNTVISAATGFLYQGVDGLTDSGNTINSATTGRGFSFISCENVKSIGSTSYSSAQQGIYIQLPGANFSLVSPSVAGVGAGVDAIYVESPSSDFTITSPIVSGSAHRYAVSFGSFSTYKLRIIGHNLTAGTSGKYAANATIQPLNTIDDPVFIYSVAYAATVTPDYSQGSYMLLGALTGDVTINNPTNMAVGQSLRIRILQDGTGGRAVTFGTSGDDKIQFTGTLTTTLNTVSLVELVYESTNRWRGYILFTGQGI